ncbi:MAG: hypothetical protein AB1806_11320 [Acidobacteriota bacterium]
MTTVLFPRVRRRLPHARALNITARTVHIAATGMLLGGHVFGIPESALRPILWPALASGAALMLLEIYPGGHWLHQNCALAVYAKLGLLCLIPFAWDCRVPLLLIVVAIASVFAHAPRTVRHYSVLTKRVMLDEPAEREPH